jgi:hypothetical protein
MMTLQSVNQINQADNNLCRIVTAGKYVRNLFRQSKPSDLHLADDNIDLAQELLVQSGFIQEPYQESNKSNVLLINSAPESLTS